jgi:hypothetical protein
LQEEKGQTFFIYARIPFPLLKSNQFMTKNTRENKERIPSEIYGEISEVPCIL